ncbi:hypothetical protein ACJMK2_018544 [Sinanodonta woodiana]|uniref:G-protein coupled receptors family 1 profile domain-containing protein n=1 Tax=Sinanodonta woodiana TaxID=1069815 RepID=A0ABD3UHD0_SINWO
MTTSDLALRLDSSLLLVLETSSQAIVRTTTRSTGEDKFISKLEQWEDSIIGAYLFIIGLLAVGLNGFALYIFYRKRSILTSNDYYILNLVVSDIILPCVAYPLSITSAFQHVWAFGNYGCTFYGFLGFYFGLVSITTLTTMSIVRYIHICKPHIDILKMETTRLIIVGTYVYSFIWAIIPVTGWGGYSVEPHGISCTLQWHNNQSYITLVAIFCIFLPSSIIVSCYGLIVKQYRQMKCRIRKWQPRSAKKTRAQKNYMIKMTFTMCCVFLTVWMPYAVVSMWTAYGRVSIIPIRLVVPSLLLAKCSIVINPIVYFILNKRFQPFFLEFANTFNKTSSVQVSVH